MNFPTDRMRPSAPTTPNGAGAMTGKEASYREREHTCQWRRHSRSRHGSVAHAGAQLLEPTIGGLTRLADPSVCHCRPACVTASRWVDTGDRVGEPPHSPRTPQDETDTHTQVRVSPSRSCRAQLTCPLRVVRPSNGAQPIPGSSDRPQLW